MLLLPGHNKQKGEIAKSRGAKYLLDARTEAKAALDHTAEEEGNRKARLPPRTRAE